jgi:hypothetical protein
MWLISCKQLLLCSSDISKSHVPVKTKAERLYLMDIDPELAAKEEAQMYVPFNTVYS